MGAFGFRPVVPTSASGVVQVPDIPSETWTLRSERVLLRALSSSGARYIPHFCRPDVVTYESTASPMVARPYCIRITNGWPSTQNPTEARKAGSKIGEPFPNRLFLYPEYDGVQCALSASSFTRVWFVIQFTSQVLPPLSEYACSKCGVLVLVFVQRNRTNTDLPFHSSWS